MADSVRRHSRARLVCSLVALLAGSYACGGSPAAPSPATLDRALPLRVESTHYTFHYAEGDSIDSARQETWHEWAIAQLAVSPDRKIDYYKYRDRTHMQQVTGKQTNGWADPAAFAAHTIWPWDDHEPVHVLTALIGRPSDFFNEGIAVALSTDPSTGRLMSLWQGRSVHDWARQFRSAGSLPRLADVVATDAFRRVDESTGYPAAGSFVRFLIDTRGMTAMRQFFTGDTRDQPRADIERRFNEAFQMSLAAAEQAWFVFLDGGAE